MKLTKEQYEALDESLRAEFELSGEHYVDVNSLKVAGLKESLDNLNAKMKRSIEEAREQALEEAKKQNNFDDVLRIEREKMADDLNRSREAMRQEVEKEFLVKQAQQSVSSDIKLLAAELAKSDVERPLVELVLSSRIKLDENGNRIYFSDDGRALSITDLDAFKGEFVKTPSLEHVLKAQTPASGGGMANGANGGGMSNKPAAEYTEKERVALYQSDPAKFNELFVRGN